MSQNLYVVSSSADSKWSEHIGKATIIHLIIHSWSGNSHDQ